MSGQIDNPSDDISQEEECSAPVGSDSSELVNGKGVILEEEVEPEQTKENTNRIRSDSVASNYDISVPEEMKNEEAKPIPQPGPFKIGQSVNLSDMILTKKKILIPGTNNVPVEMEVPLLYSMAYETQPILNEFLFELNHISECILTNNTCPFSWCTPLKRIVSHASICTDMTCKECIVLRPILLFHSMQCMKLNCILPFCNQYRCAWNMFIVNMKGCPAPNLLELFSLVCTRFTSGVPEVSPFSEGHEVSPVPPTSPIPNGLHSAPHSPTHASVAQRSASISHPPSVPYPSLRHDHSTFTPPTMISQSPTPAAMMSKFPTPAAMMSQSPTPAAMMSQSPTPAAMMSQSAPSTLLSPQPALSQTPTPVSILSPQPNILNQPPTTLMTQQQQSGTSLVSNRRRDTPLATHYIECTLCHKKRAVPISIDDSVLPNFVCSLNIWDVQYSSCSAPENIQNNYTISLAGRTPQYSHEQSEFICRLKAFLKDHNMGTFKQPMLGKREVDLYRLFREVTAYGGCDNVVKKEGTWSKIYRGMDNYSPTETSASYRLKKIYIKYLIGFEKKIFNFHSSMSSTLQEPPLSYNNTPRSPAAITPKGYTYPYPQFSPYPQYQQPIANPPKNYSASTSPLPQQQPYSPVPSILTYQQIPYMPISSVSKSYQPQPSLIQPNQPQPSLIQPNQPSLLQPVYNDLLQPSYTTYDNLPSKRFCAEPSSELQQPSLPAVTAVAYNDPSAPSNEDVQTILNIRRSISPMPPMTESTGKWESLMTGATETANQQNSSVNNGNMHI